MINDKFTLKLQSQDPLPLAGDSISCVSRGHGEELSLIIVSPSKTRTKRVLKAVDLHLPGLFDWLVPTMAQLYQQTCGLYIECLSLCLSSAHYSMAIWSLLRPLTSLSSSMKYRTSAIGIVLSCKWNSVSNEIIYVNALCGLESSSVWMKVDIIHYYDFIIYHWIYNYSIKEKEQWISKTLVYSYKKSLRNQKKEQSPDYAIAWVNLENIRLNERTHSQKDYIHISWFNFCEISEMGKSVETEREFVAA